MIKKNNVEDYFKTELGIDVQLNAVKKLPDVPEYVLNAYDVWTSDFDGECVYFIASGVDWDGPADAVKLTRYICENTGRLVIFVTDSDGWYEYFRAFRHNHMNLVVPEKMAYCPDLFIVMKKYRKSRMRRKDETKIQPYAQCILIRQLLYGDMEGIDIEKCAEMMGVTYGTCQKALKWLCDNGYAVKNGKNVHFPDIDKDYYMKAVSVMENPVKNEVWVAGRPDGIICGEHAMDHYTMLAAGNSVKEIACMHDDIVGCETLPDGIGTKLCVWKYNPKVTAQDGFIDPISLYLSMKDNEDDRIQIELKHLKENLYHGRRN